MVRQGVLAQLRRWSNGIPRRPPLHMDIYSIIFRRAFSTKLFVGGLSFRVDEEMLRKAFEEHGQVLDVRIIKDRNTGQSRGFGFVTYAQQLEAEAAKSKMGTVLLDGRYIRVDMASDRSSSTDTAPRPSPFGNPPSSPSGFSFGRGGTRPPVVEDWGPILSYTSNNNNHNNNNSSNGYDNQNVNTVPQVSESSGFCSSSFGTVPSSGSPPSSSSPSITPDAGFMSAGTSTASSFASVTSSFNNSTQSSLNSTQSGLGQQGSISGSLLADIDRLVQPDMKTNSSPKTSTGSYDFKTLPELQSSSYQDYKRPAEMDKPKRKVGLQNIPYVPPFQKKLTVDSIPSFKGTPYDFGLAGLPSEPPTSQSAVKPHHGGLDININLESIKEESDDEQPYSFFTHRTLPPLDLPWDTPEADNWSEIGKEPRRIEDSPYSPFSPDLKDDPEFWWDPYDFDDDARLPKEPEAQATEVEHEQSASVAA